MAKISLKTANSRTKSKFDLSSTHITTMDFGHIFPTNILPLVNGDKMNIGYKMFSRMSPLVVPTFGSFQMHTRSFFVPYRLLCDSFENFMQQSKDPSLPQELPYITNRQLMFFFTAKNGTSIGPTLSGLARVTATSSSSTPISMTELPDGVDFLSSFMSGVSYEDAINKNMNTQNSPSYSNGQFVLTEKGRYFYHVLQALGYSINWNLADNTQFSLLPLLAYARAMYDWIYPAQYVMQQGFGSLFKSSSWTQNLYSSSAPNNLGLTPIEPYSLRYSYAQYFPGGNSSTNISLVVSTLASLFESLELLTTLMFSPAAQDFFTSAWLQPNSVAQDQFDVLSVGGSTTQLGASVGGNNPNLTLDSVRATSQATGVFMYTPNSESSGMNQASSALHRLMTSLSDYMLRNNIGGSRFLEYMKSHFGYTTEVQRLQYSQFLKSWSHELNIQDVTATTGTDTQLLGEMAGKGFISGSDGMTFSADEHGFLIFLSSIVPRTGYYQGRKPWTMRKMSNLDFYTPEMDSVGLEPIRVDALVSDFVGGGTTNSNNTYYPAPNGIFGFCPHYAHEYKHGHDYLTGDFRLNSRNTGLDSYHSMRTLGYVPDESSVTEDLFPYPELDASFMQITPYAYDRIFAEDPTQGDSHYDHFIVIFRYQVDAYRDMLSISDSMPLFDGKGRTTSVEMNGHSL